MKYAFLEGDHNKYVILSNSLTTSEEEQLVKILEANQKAIGWTFSNLKGINPSYYMHKVLMEENYKPIAQPQRCLNPKIKEVVRKEVIKLLEVGIIYPISNSK